MIDNETGHAVEIYLATQTEVLDFISLLSMARNDHIFICISYEKHDYHKLDELCEKE